MSELKERVRHANDEELVIDAGYVKRGIAEGMKGFFKPYKSLYEAITGKEQISVGRDTRTGRFMSTSRREHRGHKKHA
jgi:hypothetical protein